jgi:hypothetical protein
MARSNSKNLFHPINDAINSPILNCFGGGQDQINKLRKNYSRILGQSAFKTEGEINFAVQEGTMSFLNQTITPAWHWPKLTVFLESRNFPAKLIAHLVLDPFYLPSLETCMR